MIAKLIKTAKDEKRLLASVISTAKGLSKKDKILSRYGLTDKQIENLDYDSMVEEQLNQFCQKKIFENTTEEASFMSAWEKLSFAERNLLVQKLENLGEKELAQRLSEKVVMFSDILKLPDSVIKALLEKTDYFVLIRALCETCGDYFSVEIQEKIRQKIYANMEPSKVKTLKEDLYFMGPVRKRDILEARRMICESVSALNIVNNLQLNL